MSEFRLYKYRTLEIDASSGTANPITCTFRFPSRNVLYTVRMERSNLRGSSFLKEKDTIREVAQEQINT